MASPMHTTSGPDHSSETAFRSVSQHDTGTIPRASCIRAHARWDRWGGCVRFNGCVEVDTGRRLPRSQRGQRCNSALA
ncbi:hypothetical protein YTPLAS18_37930 [Nitrospira sp.]|nr:hypothetical protein YTPLAS18_37930 [Nitrospira sp.]